MVLQSKWISNAIEFQTFDQSTPSLIDFRIDNGFWRSVTEFVRCGVTVNVQLHIVADLSIFPARKSSNWDQAIQQLPEAAFIRYLSTLLRFLFFFLNFVFPLHMASQADSFLVDEFSTGFDTDLQI
ncbi:hypothetical protein AVEN_35794-1 [Araneus ventricosus]|uniref:Uncharacterized protein n=1 Tax=Araneus ventricosus TaxID=182803 RepID=A0A4Y2BM19_ARAVE|nr:hypothetical protein AVEN_35794-1 [Araneus ventricosus]